MPFTKDILGEFEGNLVVIVYSEGKKELALTGWIDEVKDDILIIRTKENIYLIPLSNILKVKIKRGRV